MTALDSAQEAPSRANFEGHGIQCQVYITSEQILCGRAEVAPLAAGVARLERGGVAMPNKCWQAGDHGHQSVGEVPGETVPEKATDPQPDALHRPLSCPATPRPQGEHRLPSPIQTTRPLSPDPETLDSRSLFLGYTPATPRGAERHREGQTRRSRAWSGGEPTGLSTRWSAWNLPKFDPGGLSGALLHMVVSPGRNFLQGGRAKPQVRPHFNPSTLLQSGTTKSLPNHGRDGYGVSPRLQSTNSVHRKARHVV